MLHLNTEKFIDKLRVQLQKNFPKGHDEPGHFLRSANFDFKDFIQSKELKKIYILPKEELNIYEKYISEKFFQELINLS